MTFEFNPSETEGTALLQGRVTQAEAIAQAKVLSWKQAKGVGGTEQWRGDQGRVEREEVRFRIFFFGDEANRTCSLYSTGICIQYPVINRNGKEMYNTYIVAVVVYYTRASLVAQTVKNLLAMQETQVRLLGQEDPLEKDMATHSNTLAWKMNREAWQAMVHRVAKSWT